MDSPSEGSSDKPKKRTKPKAHSFPMGLLEDTDQTTLKSAGSAGFYLEIWQDVAPGRDLHAGDTSPRALAQMYFEGELHQVFQNPLTSLEFSRPVVLNLPNAATLEDSSS